MHSAQRRRRLKVALQVSAALVPLVAYHGAASAQTVSSSGPSQRIVEADSADAGGDDKDILVTGSRIAGAESASPATRIAQADILLAGQGDLGEALRSLPFNFSGGQNPGVMQGTIGIVNRNQTDGAGANLRGLGPDATLTLVNGHRLAYDGASQAVDISNIPLAAVNEVQIIPDGTSALYGSDAVAGVVNILLKPDFTGVEASARLVGATDGGGFEHQYSVTTGGRWTGGGLIVSGQYGHQNSVSSEQRAYTTGMGDPSDLLPRRDQFSFIGSAHQSVGAATLSLDGLYNNRLSYWRFAPADNTFSYDARPHTIAWVIAPTLSYRVSNSWSVSLSGSVGQDESKARGGTTDIKLGTTKYATSCDCNHSKGAEFGAEGSAFDIAGGQVRLAVGAGYRENSYYSITYSNNSRQGGKRKAFYGYGEVNVPLVSDQNGRPGLRQLKFSAAGRYESYDDVGDVFTPKLGLIYSPTDDIDLKATWGRSFKAPTLLQQYQRSYLYLYPAFLLGASNVPSNATVLFPYGGNRNLKPERSESWSTTINLHPTSLPGLRVSATFFHINYRDRVIQPIDPSVALSNPIYADFVIRNPDQSAKDALFAAADQFITFAGAYDPAKVVAIASNVFTNAANQTIKGVDLAPSYSFKWRGGDMTLSGAASWLEGRQRSSSNSPAVPLAGYVFNPPHFRVRAGVNYAGSRFYGAAFFNYSGGVKDNRTTTVVDGASFATIDLSVGARFGAAAGKSPKLEVQLFVQNLANEKPPFLRAPDASFAPYDSTNYSALGRTVGVSIRTHW